MLSRNCLLSVVLTYLLNSVPLVHAQNDNPPGFLSIDCGLPEGSDYNVSSTGIYYQSDANLIDSGESKSISPSLIGDTPEIYLTTIRSFPRGKKNCYTIQPSLGKGHKYLIRATFKYGNYDSLNQFPTFDLNLGADTWSKIALEDSSTVVRKEIIHILSSDYIHICLINTDTGTPFISALELRPLNSSNSVYKIDSGSLQTFARVDCDYANNLVVRYPKDIYDRRWAHLNLTNTRVSTLLDIINGNDYLVPMDVLRTASTPDNLNDSIKFSWDTTNTSDQIYIYMHFAEVEKLQANYQLREFNIYVNEELSYGPVVPVYLSAFTIYPNRPVTGNTRHTVVIKKTERSTLPPIINGYEIYTAKKFSNSGTNETDVAAILNIKSTYGVIKDWQGDPCEPEDFLWDGLKCSYHSSEYSARIISLNLSTSGLNGEIVPSIVNLTQLETLDLSNNNLSGQIPGFLSQLALLSVLNLKGNNFTGPVPPQLLENKEKGILSLSFDESHGNNKNIEKKSNMSTPTVVGVVVGLVLILAAILFGIWIVRGRVMRVFKKSGKQPQVNISDRERSDIERENSRFTYSQVVDITRNFHRVLGEGGFGTVYHGIVGDMEVAVKMLSPSSSQGYREFQTEASLLMRIHHKNLTSLVGYCNEGTNMGLIYEYMANQSLDKYLSGKSYPIISWELRLQIALDAAQGLEYLHHGCKPAIIHRDVKTGNILLNEHFQAKLADFGLSKAYPAEGGTHISTTFVSGTHGYIDPDYENSKRVTEKSDVFSFGVVLLVMITAQPPILSDKTHISEWVHFIVQNGDVTQVVDPRLGGKYDVNSVWKAVELALSCTSRNSSRRPTMNMVVINLKECLAIENGSHDDGPNDSNEMLSIDIERKNSRFTYSQVVDITRNFHRVLGDGGFGTVYHGYVGDMQVAVKMLSASSPQGYREFQTEASLLMRIHHKNLTSLVGYCNEGTNMGLIYEYMANQSLDKYLSGESDNILTWELRLQIALDAAQGLEYLHHGCKPAIIHRDVKTSNILLNEHFHAKLADFGLSKAYPAEGGTHISTTVVSGTPGYIDPDYENSKRLTEKSDVFSFGVVLLVMITGRPPVLSQDGTRCRSIYQWVDSIVQNGDVTQDDVTQVVDPRLGGKYDVNSVWKAIELALSCTSRNSSRRPTMNMVVINLKECLAIEIGSHGIHLESHQ